MMAVSVVKTIYLLALQGYPVEVQADVRQGMPSFKIVGLPSEEVQEARERVLSAIKNLGISLGARKITVNLSPAELVKRGTHGDLAIAISVLEALLGRQILPSDVIPMGELTLDGRVIVPSQMFALVISGINLGFTRFVVPADAIELIRIFKGIEVFPIERLSDLLSPDGNSEFRIMKGTGVEGSKGNYLDFADVKGQTFAKHAAMISAAGMHPMVMVGSPGVGKTMIAKRVPGILPPMTLEEMLEVTAIHSAVLGVNVLMDTRPLRAPHPSLSPSAMFGGGRRLMPGEVTLAHRGVLFLDEFPEFRKDVLEGLRTVVEEKKVLVSRADGKAEFPADFLLVMASNPCPCGYLGHPVKMCRCSVADIKRYQRKFSGPLMDRMDIQIWMSPPKSLVSDGIDTGYMREKVISARERQRVRYGSNVWNGTVSDAVFREKSGIHPQAYMALKELTEGGLDLGRASERVLRVARTIADLEGADYVTDEHVFQAAQFRRLMLKMVMLW